MVVLTIFIYTDCGPKHTTHIFDAVEGLPVFDVPQDSTFDLNRVGTCSFNGKTYCYLKSNISKETMTSGKYIHSFDKVAIKAGDLGNDKDVTTDFIEVYTEKQVVQDKNGSNRLSCTTTGMKCCYNGPSFTSPPTIVQLGTTDAWFVIVHDHNLASNVGRYVTFANANEISEFTEKMSEPYCHSLSFNNVPTILTVNSTSYETYPFGTFTID